MKYIHVYKRPRSPFWQIAYLDGSGFRRRVATTHRTDNPLGYRRALEEATERGRAGLALLSTARLEHWADWVPGFLARRYTSPRTLERARGAWKWLAQYFTEKGIPGPRALGYPEVVGYVDWRTSIKRPGGGSFARNTALTDVRILSAVMREAVKLGMATANPCAQLGLKKEKPPEKPEMTDAEIELIRRELPAWAEKHGHQWMVNNFEIALHQGCRLRETRVDLVRDVDLKQRTITFRTKGDKVWATELHPKLVDLFTRLRADGKRYPHDPVPNLASKHWREFFDELELKHLTFHCLRVTVVTRLARAGVPLQQAMRFVGHSSSLVHAIYLRLRPGDLGRALDALAFD